MFHMYLGRYFLIEINFKRGMQPFGGLPTSLPLAKPVKFHLTFFFLPTREAVFHILHTMGLIETHWSPPIKALIPRAPLFLLAVS